MLLLIRAILALGLFFSGVSHANFFCWRTVVRAQPPAEVSLDWDNLPFSKGSADQIVASKDFGPSMAEVVDALQWLDAQNDDLFPSMGVLLSDPCYSADQPYLCEVVARIFKRPTGLRAARQLLINELRPWMDGTLTASTNERLLEHLMTFPEVTAFPTDPKLQDAYLGQRNGRKLNAFVRSHRKDHLATFTDLFLDFDTNHIVATDGSKTRRRLVASIKDQVTDQQIYTVLRDKFFNPFVIDYKKPLRNSMMEKEDRFSEIINEHGDNFLERQNVTKPAHRRIVIEMLRYVLKSDRITFSGDEVYESFRLSLIREGVGIQKLYHQQQAKLQQAAPRNSPLEPARMGQLVPETGGMRPALSRRRAKRENAQQSEGESEVEVVETTRFPITEEQRRVLLRYGQEYLEELESPHNLRFHQLFSICSAIWGTPRNTGGSHHIFRAPWRGAPILLLTSHPTNVEVVQVVKVRAGIRKMLAEIEAQGSP